MPPVPMDGVVPLSHTVAVTHGLSENDVAREAEFRTRLVRACERVDSGEDRRTVHREVEAMILEVEEAPIELTPFLSAALDGTLWYVGVDMKHTAESLAWWPERRAARERFEKVVRHLRERIKRSRSANPRGGVTIPRGRHRGDTSGAPVPANHDAASTLHR